MADEHREIDALTGTATTGHEWDGIRELNTPLPRWWLWMFYATIVWAIGYWIVYPAWPLLTNSTQGVWGWHSRAAVVSDLEALKAQRGPMMEKLADASVAEIAADPQLSDFARAQGRAAFAENCAPCHGAGGGGAKGYPNLNDDDWLWGGKLAQIEQTIRHGVRSGDKDDHEGGMPAFGRDVLKPTRFQRSPTTCARWPACRPNPASISRRQEGLRRQLRGLSRAGRQGQPRTRRAQSHRRDLALRLGQGGHRGRRAERPRRRDAGLGGRLPEPTIKALAVYVHSFGGGEK